MELFDDMLAKPPDATNQQGTKFWVEQELTRYAQKPNVHGVTLPAVVVLLAQAADGLVSRLIIEGDQWLYENTSREAIACYIEAIKAERSIP